MSFKKGELIGCDITILHKKKEYRIIGVSYVLEGEHQLDPKCEDKGVLRRFSMFKKAKLPAVNIDNPPKILKITNPKYIGQQKHYKT